MYSKQTTAYRLLLHCIFYMTIVSLILQAQTTSAIPLAEISSALHSNLQSTFNTHQKIQQYDKLNSISTSTSTSTSISTPIEVENEIVQLPLVDEDEEPLYTIQAVMEDPGMQITVPSINFIVRITGPPRQSGKLTITIPPLTLQGLELIKYQVFTSASFEAAICIYEGTEKFFPLSHRPGEDDSFELIFDHVPVNSVLRCFGIKTPEYEVLVQKWEQKSASWLGTALQCYVQLFTSHKNPVTQTLSLVITPVSEPLSVYSAITTTECDTYGDVGIYIRRAPFIIKKEERMYIFANETNHYFDPTSEKILSCTIDIPEPLTIAGVDTNSNNLDHGIRENDNVGMASIDDIVIQNINNKNPFHPTYNDLDLQSMTETFTIRSIPVSAKFNRTVNAIQIFRLEDIDLSYGLRLYCTNIYTHKQDGLAVDHSIYAKLEIFHPTKFLRKYSVSFNNFSCQHRGSLYKNNPIFVVDSVVKLSVLRVTGKLIGVCNMNLLQHDIITFIGAGMPDSVLNVEITSLSIQSPDDINRIALSTDFDGFGSSFRFTFLEKLQSLDEVMEIGVIFSFTSTTVLPTTNMWGLLAFQRRSILAGLDFLNRVIFENTAEGHERVLTLKGSIYTMIPRSLHPIHRNQFLSILTADIRNTGTPTKPAVCRMSLVAEQKDISHHVIIQCLHLERIWDAYREFYSAEEKILHQLMNLELDPLKPTDGDSGGNADNVDYGENSYSNDAISSHLSNDGPTPGRYASRLEIHLESLPSECVALNRFGEYSNCVLPECIGRIGCESGLACRRNSDCVSNICHKKDREDLDSLTGVCINYGQQPTSPFSWYFIVIIAVAFAALVIVVIMLIRGCRRRRRLSAMHQKKNQFDSNNINNNNIGGYNGSLLQDPSLGNESNLGNEYNNRSHMSLVSSPYDNTDVFQQMQSNLYDTMLTSLNMLHASSISNGINTISNRNGPHHGHNAGQRQGQDRGNVDGNDNNNDIFNMGSNEAKNEMYNAELMRLNVELYTQSNSQNPDENENIQEQN